MDRAIAEARTYSGVAMNRCAALMLVLALAAPSSAQAQAPAVSGTVADETGGVMPGAKITLIDSTSGATREAIADRAGRFRFEGLASGRYLLRVEFEGFLPVEQPIELPGDGIEPLAIKMKIGIEQEVEVTGSLAEAERLSPRRNADAVDIDDELLRRLPLPTRGRGLMDFVGTFLAPAAQGTDEGSLLVDGFETTRQLNVPIWSVRRVVINRGPYSAEYRRPGKARVEVVTQDGSRRHHHGGVALSLRNSAWDARPPFARTRPDLDRRGVEFSFSGPITDRLTFFLSGEHLSNEEGAVVNARTLQGPIVENIPATERETTLLGRFDVRPSPEVRFTARYQIENESERHAGIGGLDLRDRGAAGEQRAHRFQFASALLATRWMTEWRGLVDRDLGRTGGPASAPAIEVAEAFRSGPSQKFRANRDTTLELQAAGTRFAGRHTVRLGGRFRSKLARVTDATNFGGTFEFASLDRFAAADPFVFRINQGRPDVSFAMHEADAFVQDEVKLGPELTLMLGLRYDWQSRLDDADNFAPRVAIAFGPGQRKTIVRSGAGVFYERMPSRVIQRTLLFDGARLHDLVIADPSFPDPFRRGAVALPPPSVVWIAPDVKTPFLFQASVGVEHELRPRTHLAVEYGALRGVNLFRARDVNAPLPGARSRPQANFLNIIQAETSAMMKSHALTASFRGRLGRRIKMTTQYTLSRTINNMANAEPGAGLPFALPADNYNLDAEVGRADFDRRHRFSFAGTAKLPGGVTLGGVLALTSGAPFDITTGFDDNRDTEANDRPAGVTRNTGQGPGLAQADLRLTKLLRVSRPFGAPDADAELEVNLDAFNAFNRVNYSTFVGVQTSPFFGQARSARQARTLQLSIKYSF